MSTGFSPPPFSWLWFKRFFVNATNTFRLWIRLRYGDRRWAIVRSIGHTLFTRSTLHRNSIMVINNNRILTPLDVNDWLAQAPWEARIRVWCSGCGKIHHEDPVLRYRPYRAKGV